MELKRLFNDKCGVLICPLNGGEAMYSHNPDRPFKSASVIKTFALAYYIANCKDFDRVIEVSRDMLIGNSIMTELKITKATVKELLVWMMSFSDNSATNILFEDAGMDNLNEFCKNFLGTKNTVIGRKMLDFAAVERGEDNLTSVNDCLLAMRYVMESPLGRDVMKRHKGIDRIMRYIYDTDVEHYGKGGNVPEVFNDICVLRKDGGEYMFVGVLSYKYDATRIRRLMGSAGLVALGADKPIV